MAEKQLTKQKKPVTFQRNVNVIWY